MSTHEMSTYSSAAHLYDMNVWLKWVSKSDIPFYLRHASQQNQDILVLACGTGRVAIPLAEHGFNVVGLDLGASMVEHFRRKVLDLPAEVRERITIVHGDMTSFDLGRKFGLIIIPFRSFQCLISGVNARSCLRSVARHLGKNGVFILNAFKCDRSLKKGWMRPERVEWEKVDEKTGVKVIKTSKTRGIASKERTITIDAKYAVVGPDGNTAEVRDCLVLKLYTRRLLSRLLKLGGFTVCNQYGYYDERPVSRGDELVFVCRRTEDARDLYGHWNVKWLYRYWNINWFVSAAQRRLRRMAQFGRTPRQH